MIKGLLKKDLYNLASYKTTLIIVVLFCGIAIIGTDAIYWGSVVIGIIVGMISLSTFSYDEMSKSNKYILTLPVTRKEIDPNDGLLTSYYWIDINLSINKYKETYKNNIY